MFLATYLVGMGCLAGMLTADLDSIGRDITEAWREDGPAGNLRVRCRFELKVERLDDALSDRYFANVLVPADKSPRSRYRVGPQTKWVEDVATRGRKYRNDHEFFDADSGETHRGWKVQKFFNGTNSWRYDCIKSMALQYPGAALTTRLTLGYYQDMIGFPGSPLEKERTTAGGTGEPYRLDKLIPSGKYRIDGGEVVDGLDCVVLTRPGLDRLWLARDRGWSIVRREWRWSLGGPLKRRVNNRDFHEIARGAWIPFEAVMEIYGHPGTRPGRRVGLLRATVLLAEADVPDDWFEPHFPKGAVVDDLETGDRYPFGMELQSLDEAVVRASSFGPMFRPVPWWRRPAWWGVGGAALLLIFAARRNWMARRGLGAR
jgi:hypothetical protein